MKPYPKPTQVDEMRILRRLRELGIKHKGLRWSPFKIVFEGQFWPFEEISIFNNGGHLGYRTALTDTILKGDHLRIISAKFG